MDVDEECTEVETIGRNHSQLQGVNDEFNKDPLGLSKKLNLIFARSVLIYTVKNHRRLGSEAPKTDYNDCAMRVCHQEVSKNWSRHMEFSNFYHRITQKNPRANPYARELREKAEALVCSEFVDGSFFERAALDRDRQLFQAMVTNNAQWKSDYSWLQERLKEARQVRANTEIDERKLKKRKDLGERIKYLSEFITMLALRFPLTDKDIEALKFIKQIDLSKAS